MKLKPLLSIKYLTIKFIEWLNKPINFKRPNRKKKKHKLKKEKIYVYVDLENVQKPDFSILPYFDKIYLLVGSKQHSLHFDVINQIRPHMNKVRFLYFTQTGDNALDHFVSFTLGRKYPKKNVTHYIYAADGDYQYLIKHLNKIANTQKVIRVSNQTNTGLQTKSSVIKKKKPIDKITRDDFMLQSSETAKYLIEHHEMNENNPKKPANLTIQLKTNQEITATELKQENTANKPKEIQIDNIPKKINKKYLLSLEKDKRVKLIAWQFALKGNKTRPSKHKTLKNHLFSLSSQIATDEELNEIVELLKTDKIIELSSNDNVNYLKINSSSVL